MPARTVIDELWKVLPPTSTDLEKDVCAVSGFDGILDPLVPRIYQSKLAAIPDNWLPWLIIEYGLMDLGEFQPNLRQLISDGHTLRFTRGTPAGIKLVMLWLGLSVLLIESDAPDLHGYEYQLDLGKVPTDLSVICKIVKLARIIQPVRSRLRRLLHGYDVPFWQWDKSPWDGDIWDNYSGVWSDNLPGICQPPPGVWFSFGNIIDGIANGIGGGIVFGDADQAVTVETDTQFAMRLDGELHVHSGPFIIDPTHPVIDGDISIDGDLHFI